MLTERIGLEAIHVLDIFRICDQDSISGVPLTNLGIIMLRTCRRVLDAIAYRVCLQKTCTQLHCGMLWKRPALAYHAIVSRTLKLDREPAWQLFRDYLACPPTGSDAQFREFLAIEEVRQCGLYPAKAIAFRHRDPTARWAKSKSIAESFRAAWILSSSRDV